MAGEVRTHDPRCETCGARFSEPSAARRHAREQRHRVVILETVDGTVTTPSLLPNGAPSYPGVDEG